MTHNTVESFMTAFLATRETAILEDIANGLVDGLDDTVRELALSELKNRQ